MYIQGQPKQRNERRIESTQRFSEENVGHAVAQEPIETSNRHCPRRMVQGLIEPI